MKKITLLMLLAFLSTASVYGVKSDDVSDDEFEFAINTLHHYAALKDISSIQNKLDALYKLNELSNTIEKVKSIFDGLFNTNEEEIPLKLKQKKQEFSAEYFAIIDQLNNFATN
ncbi:MAG: hypothetical protein Q8S31_06325 [Alphaproteobacteria bacterium]|nr:hypothetical protein [Alphaproteobacteria bacterium]